MAKTISKSSISYHQCQYPPAFREDLFVFRSEVGCAQATNFLLDPTLPFRIQREKNHSKTHRVGCSFKTSGSKNEKIPINLFLCQRRLRLGIVFFLGEFKHQAQKIILRRSFVLIRLSLISKYFMDVLGGSLQMIPHALYCDWHKRQFHYLSRE